MTDRRQFNGLNLLNVAYWQRNRDELKRGRRKTISLLLSLLTRSLLSTTSIISVSCTTNCIGYNYIVIQSSNRNLSNKSITSWHSAIHDLPWNHHGLITL